MGRNVTAPLQQFHATHQAHHGLRVMPGPPGLTLSPGLIMKPSTPTTPSSEAICSTGT